MTVHKKTRRRVQILVITMLLIGVAATVAYVVRKRQIAERTIRDRDAGYAALDGGDYFNALHKIGPYVQRNPDDVEALVKYANARRNVEEPNGKHLIDSIALYRRILERTPDHSEAREKLLEIYIAAGFNTEINTATEGRVDSASLRARSIAQAALGNDDKASEALDKYLAMKPDDLRMQMFAIMRMQRADRPKEEIVEYASKLSAAYPNDPRFDLLTGFAYGAVENREEAIKYTLKATAQPMTDPDHIEVAVDMLDSVDREDEAIAVLMRAADIGKNERFQRRVIARLFQSRQFNLVDQRVSALAAADPKLGAELHAYRALALIELGRHEDADRVVAELASRKNDFAAAAWAGVLASIPRGVETPDDRRIIQACRDALRGEADNPYFRLQLGDAYNRLGEADLARTEWYRAAEGARVWPEPLKRLVQVLIATGQSESLRVLAARLQRLAPNDPQSLATAAIAQARLVNRKDTAAVEQLFALIDRVQELRPGDEVTLRLKVGFLAATERKDEARKVLTAALAATPPPSVATIVALAQASESASLGLESDCFKRCLETHGMSIQLALAEAGWMARSGRPADALKFLEAAREKASDKDHLSWKIATAQLLDEAKDDRAAKFWVELADGNPENASVQRAALSAPAVASDRALQKRVIDRLHEIIGDTGVSWRIAEARWILDGTEAISSEQDRERELVKATALLNDLAQSNPDQLTVRLMLSDCLLRLRKPEDAITQLTAAVRLAPGAFAPAVQLAALMQASGDFEGAKPYLEQAERVLSRSDESASSAIGSEVAAISSQRVTIPGSSPELTRESAWRMISSLYAARGEPARAIEILQRLGGDKPADLDLAMAEMLARRGELSDEACEKLLQKPTLAGIGIVVEQLAGTGRITEAEAALKRVESIDTKPGEKELLRGVYHQRRAAYPLAIPELDAATKLMPTSAAAWRALIVSNIMDGRGDDAASAVTRAHAALPDDSSFKDLAENQAIIRATAATPRLRPLLVTLATDPEAPDELLAALKIARDANETGKSVAEVLSALRPIADRVPRLAVLQYLVADLYQVTGNNEDAVRVTTRLMQLLPADPAPAQRATELLASTGRWSQLIPIAQQWRYRLGANTRPADEAIAAAFVATGQFAAALSQLEKYATVAAASPADWVRVLTLRAQALIGLNRLSEAEALILPALPSSASLRGSAVQIATRSIVEPGVTVRWMDQISAASPADSIEERLLLARAWQDLSQKPGNEALRARAEGQLSELTTRLTAKPDAKAETWAALGMLKEVQGDVKGADAAYRSALRIDARQSVAQNNLAMLLIRNGGDTNEALQLAEDVAKDSSRPGHTEFLDTLAQVQLKAGKPEAAEKSLRTAVALAADNLQLRANLVQLLIDVGKRDEGKKVFDELNNVAAGARQSDPQFDARLKSLATALTQ